MNQKNTRKLGLPTSIRFTESADEKINLACEKLCLTKPDIVRLAVDIGLRRLEAIDYDIARAVLDAAEDASTARVSDLLEEERGVSARRLLRRSRSAAA